jgi:hypothetical protein
MQLPLSSLKKKIIIIGPDPHKSAFDWDSGSGHRRREFNQNEEKIEVRIKKTYCK